MKSLTTKLSISVCALSAMQVGYSNAKPAERPNVIIILTDDQGYGDLSFTGNPILKTPNIDRLARENVFLSDFHVAPMSTPTRSQLMTGRDAISTGAFMVCCGSGSIYHDIPTMPEIFRKAGYATGLFGKWHLGDNYPNRPMDRGFDQAVWIKGWGTTATSDYWNNDNFDDFYYHNDRLTQYEGYCTDVWFNQTMQWIEARGKAGQPFLAYLATNAPHAPLFVADKYREPYKSLNRGLASFFGMIANIDENMGRLDAMLERTGLKENTILIFMTDNGGTAGVSYYNAGMQGKKMSLYDGGHRVPCIIRWNAGNLAKGTEITDLVQVQDILPTILDLCNIKQKNKFDGTSIAPALRGKKQKELDERIAIVQYGRQPFYSLEMPTQGDACVMWNKWRLLDDSKLYNVATDPHQDNDVAAAHPEIVRKMKDHYHRWWNRVEPLVYNKIVPFYIGKGMETPTTLTSFDWLTLNTSDQIHIRQGHIRSGAWNVSVADPGNYRFELYRWPRESGLRLTEASPEYKGVDGVQPEGVAFPIVRANLRIGVQEYTVTVTNSDHKATFDVFLPKGDTRIETTFYNEKRDQLCGAYYVYITRLE